MPISGTEHLLQADKVNFFYGKAQALYDLDLAVGAGEIVALVGRNGAGKSTTMKVLAGLQRQSSGSICFNGHDVTTWEEYRRARVGISYVPEDRQVFPNLTALENLKVAQLAGQTGNFGLDEIFDIFPQLRSKRDTLGENLSGGEQQMLSVSRALLTNPKLLLLDEPTEGLAPVVIEAMIAALRKIHAAGVSLLLVEQNFKFTSSLAARQYLIDSGKIVWSGTTAEFQRDREKVENLLL